MAPETEFHRNVGMLSEIVKPLDGEISVGAFRGVGVGVRVGVGVGVDVGVCRALFTISKMVSLKFTGQCESLGSAQAGQSLNKISFVAGGEKSNANHPKCGTLRDSASSVVCLTTEGVIRSVQVA